MKVLFVCSGNSKNFKIVPFIKAQGESLKELDIDVEYFPIIGKGVWGYLKACKRLRDHLKKNDYDIVHAHFTLSGWAAVTASKNTPIVLSLMGTDAQGDYVGENKIKFKSRGYMALTYLIQPFVNKIISKSKNIEEFVYLKKRSHLIPNGVNLDVFHPQPIDKINAQLNLPIGKKTVLFLGSKDKIVKNFSLAQKAVLSLNRRDVELINPFPMPHQEMPLYLNAVDLLVVPSFMEGSPNIIKEAMACNCPIVATDVGDIKWVMGNTRGCYTASFNVEDFSNKIQMALEFSDRIGRTNGYGRIKALGLDSATIAGKISSIYEEACSREKSWIKKNTKAELQ